MNSPPHTWLPLQQVLCLDGSDLRHGGEDVGAVGSCPLDAVAVVDLSVTRFLIHIELNCTEKREKDQSSHGGYSGTSVNR